MTNNKPIFFLLKFFAINNFIRKRIFIKNTKMFFLIRKKYFILFPFVLISIIYLQLQNNLTNSGRISNSKKLVERPKRYTILSCSITGSFKEQQYCFYIPIAIMAWKRIDYDCLVVISIFKKYKIDKANLKAIETIKSLGVKLVIIEIEHENIAMVRLFSMVSRIFSGAIDTINDDDFILTSDSDLVPIRNTSYLFKNIDHINLFNAFCCDKFEYLNKSYQMYALSNIGMKKKYWREVMQLDKEFKFSAVSVLGYISKEFREKFNESLELHAGESLWYMDQYLVSIRIGDYEAEHGDILRKFSQRGYRLDRADVSFWETMDEKRLRDYVDSHLFQSPGIFEKWNLLQRFFKIIFNETDFQFIENYYREYKSLSSYEL